MLSKLWLIQVFKVVVSDPSLDCSSSSSAQLVIREEGRQLQQPQARLDGPMLAVLLVSFARNSSEQSNGTGIGSPLFVHFHCFEI
jgi:hypothetical protein